MKRLLTAAALAALLAAPALAAEPESCADGALLRRRLDRHHRDDRGRPARSCARSATRPTSASCRCRSPTPGSSKGDIDVFLGNWMPTMEADLAPLPRRRHGRGGARRTSRARSTRSRSRSSLADAGLKDFADIAEVRRPARQHDLRHRARQRRQPADPRHDRRRTPSGSATSSWRRAPSRRCWRRRRGRRSSGEGIVFLGWEPHPMNANIEMTYLTGGDEVFGPNFGGATVYTNVRKGYVDGMPERRQAAAEPRVHASTMENEIMGAILDDGEDPDDAAAAWLKANPDVLERLARGRDHARRRRRAGGGARRARRLSRAAGARPDGLDHADQDPGRRLGGRRRRLADRATPPGSSTASPTSSTR